MKTLFLCLVTIMALVKPTLAQVNCSAETREKTAQGFIVKKEQLNETNTGDSSLTKLNVDIDEAYFSFIKQDQSITTMIVLGPDYTLGNLARGGFDENGELKLSYVTPNKTFILSCK